MKIFQQRKKFKEELENKNNTPDDYTNQTMQIILNW